MFYVDITVFQITFNLEYNKKLLVAMLHGLILLYLKFNLNRLCIGNLKLVGLKGHPIILNIEQN